MNEKKRFIKKNLSLMSFLLLNNKNGIRLYLNIFLLMMFNSLSASNDWHGAKWIGYNPKVERYNVQSGAESHLNWKDQKWIWTGETNEKGEAPAGIRLFRCTIDVPDFGLIRSAWLSVSADDHCRVYLDKHQICPTDHCGQVVEREVTEYLKLGKNNFNVQIINNEISPAGLVMKIIVEYSDGRIAEFSLDASNTVWRTGTAENDESWLSLTSQDSGWKPVVELGAVGMAPWGELTQGYYPGSNQSAPSPMLRKTFSVNKKLQKVILKSSGLGCHEVYINGTRVGNSVLDPATSQYDKTVLYVEHDVTKLLKQGKNAIGVMLGNGWFAHPVHTTWNFDEAVWHDRPKLLLSLTMEYTDGTKKTVVSDTSWRADLSPVLADDFMSGEVYDAQMEQDGWAKPNFDESKWNSAEEMSPPGGVLTLQKMAPIRVTRTVKPVSISEIRPGVYLFDLGQNISGWARIRVKGKPGQMIRLSYSERINDNRLDKSMGEFVWTGWYQEDRYVLKGKEMEEWEPRFTYHGFRYVEVEGLTQKPTLSDLDGRLVHTDFNSVGTFECSDSFVNQVQNAVLQSYRCNFHGFPTDCPTREKKGWTGDAHLAVEQAMLNWDNRAGYEKWMGDFADVQNEAGLLKAVIPSPGWSGDEFDWDVANIIIPWTVYIYTGNKAIVQKSYPMMCRWANFYFNRNSNRIIDCGVSDWCPAKTITPKEITSTCFFYGALIRLSKMAELMDKKDDAIRYKEYAAQVFQAFNKGYVSQDGNVGKGSQSAQALALYFEILPEKLRTAAAKKLSEAVTNANDHVDVGILGSKALFRMLSQYGYHEQAWRVLQQKTAPGYGSMLAVEPTTLSENWDGHASQNHIMFGDISGWFYSYLAGIQIDPASPGFKHFILRPMPAGDLKWVKAEHRSPYGLIRSRWDKNGDGTYTAQFTVPAGTRATIILPDGHREDVGTGNFKYTWRGASK
ncbi:MAG: family 78 glycoside hydrolase catalytic domain [Bacteroidota bacterium]|nr:family 78 glycoside hydrolase catalytic domain [Bacteroidota bacterium]